MWCRRSVCGLVRLFGVLSVDSPCIFGVFSVYFPCISRVFPVYFKCTTDVKSMYTSVFTTCNIDIYIYGNQYLHDMRT